MKSQLFRERRYRFAIALILCISLCVSPMNAFALDSISTEPMLPIPTAEEAAASVSAISYSISPDHLYPFIYDGTAPSSWREIDTTNCVIGQLYVHNSNTNQVTPIGEATVTGFTTTQDQLFYVTADQQIIQTDYTGTNHTSLYRAASGEIIDLDYFNGVLNFIEGGNRAVLLDVTSRQAATVLNQEELCSLFFFDDDKFIWRDPSYEPFYYNISTREGKGFDNEHELNCFLAPYTTPDMTGSTDVYWLNSISTENDVSLPLPEYPANLTWYDDSGYETAISYFRYSECNHAVSTETCKRYARTNQCDGFAVYAHEKFVHLSNTTWGTPHRAEGDTFIGECSINNQVDKVRSFFAGLNKGAFIRYGRYVCDSCRDDDPCKCTNKDQCSCAGQASCGSAASVCECTSTHTHEVCKEQHSAVFIAATATGVWIYECNQDSVCGVAYTFYSYETIASRYHCIRIAVNHTFVDGKKELHSTTKHRRYCVNCSGYLVQSHTGTKYATGIDGAQHELWYSCCSGATYEAHTLSYGECTVCGYS